MRMTERLLVWQADPRACDSCKGTVADGRTLSIVSHSSMPETLTKSLL